MKIKVMPKHMADLIAAGEVVERPSSVVKELMENAVDAGASALSVEIKGGGRAYIRVSDNGSGIAEEDLPLAFKPHATSKIETQSDLEKIATLGFRGEALASICAVSRVEVLTMAAGEPHGTSYKISGGCEQSAESAGCPKGTTVIVRDLFYNTPARLKFLKRDTTEGNYVAAVVDKAALSHPEVKISFIREGRQELATAGNGNLYDTVFTVFGKDFAHSLMKVDYTLGNIHIWGFISKPVNCKANRSMQYFFVNGRQIKSVTAMSALENSYKNSVMVGKVPACVLNIDVAPESVDVNVSPSKTEVRFENDKQIFDAVYYACKNSLMVEDEPKKLKFSLNSELRKAKAEQQTFSDFSSSGGFSKSAPQQTAENFWQHKTAAQGVGTDSLNDKKGSAALSNICDDDRQPLSFIASADSNTAPYDSAQSLSSARSDDNFQASYKRRNIDIEFDDGMDFAEKKISDKKGESTVHGRPAAESQNIHENGRVDFAEGESTVYDKPAAESQNIHENGEQIAQSEKAENRESAAAVNFRVVGEVFKTYIIAEQGDEVLFIDKHAAHERMIFEELKKQPRNNSQVLLEPVNVTLSKEDYNAVLENLVNLRHSGFWIDDFGSGTVRVREYPLMLENTDVALTVEETAGYLREHRREFTPETLDWLYHNVACRAAVKAGNFTSLFEMEKFVGKLLSMPDIRYCPHGRPVMTVMTKHEFEKQFGRA